MASPLCVYTGVDGGAASVATGPIARDTAPERLETLFHLHQSRLYRLARRMTRTADDARDLVQDVFVRAARSAKSIPEGASREEAWLVRVLVNVCRDGWRKRAGRRRLDDQHLADTRPKSQGDPESVMVARATVWKALQDLTPRRRAAIVLYELEGVTIPDIARLLGISVVTVRWHLSRGRHELAAIIDGAADLPPSREASADGRSLGEGRQIGRGRNP